MHKHPLVHALLFVAVLSLLLGAALPVQADSTGQETNLASGDPWEANLDSQGKLWISYTTPSEIWRADTVNGGITRFLVGGSPSDARGDGAGNVWWADLDGNLLHETLLRRLNTTTNQLTAWTITNTDGLFTTAIDAQGRVWVSDWSYSNLFRLNSSVSPNQLCTYALPDSGLANYMTTNGDYLWFVDGLNTRIVRLQISTGRFDWWNVPEDSNLWDVAYDASSGNVWWTDQATAGKIGRLNPTAGTLTSYPLPDDLVPQMISLKSGLVWFTFVDPTTSEADGVGRLDPASATGTALPLSTGNLTVTPTCTNITPTTSNVTSLPRTTTWTDISYTTLHNAGGWLTYRMPANGATFGIAASDQIWFLDLGRDKLARMSAATPLAAPAVQISRVSANVQLSWIAVPGATGYSVWFDTLPYFTPTGNGATATSPWTHGGVLNQPGSYFYVVRSTAGTEVSSNSNRTGEFTFSLVKGSN